MDCFWNVCCKWKFFIYLFTFSKNVYKHRTVLALASCSGVPNFRDHLNHCFPKTLQEKGMRATVPSLHGQVLFFSLKDTLRHGKRNAACFQKKRRYLIHRLGHPVDEVSLPYHTPPEAGTQMAILSLFSCLSKRISSPLFPPHRSCEEQQNHMLEAFWYDCIVSHRYIIHTFIHFGILLRNAVRI